MIARIYSILIALAAMFGIMINTPFAKSALLIVAAMFEFAVILICIITLLEVIPTELKLRTKIKTANRV